MSTRRAAQAAPTWPAHVAGAVGFVLLTMQLYSPDGDFWGNLLSQLTFLTFEYAALAVGWLLAWRRPRVALGWLLLAVPLLLGIEVPADLIGFWLQPVAPAAADWAFWVGGGTGSAVSGNWILPIGLLFVQLPLRFPTGRLPSPRWRWFDRYTFVALPVASFIVSSGPAEYAKGAPNPTRIHFGALAAPVGVGSLLLGLGVPAVVAVTSLFIRYRRGSETERAQLRWIFWGLAVPIGLLLLHWATELLFGLDTVWGGGTDGFGAVVDDVASSVVALSYTLVPIAIYLAVSRHGLYSIDRVISRTAAYATVTAIVVGGYAGIVLGGSVLLPRLPAVGVAVATLAAAGAFLPLLRLVRVRVDRRFDRARYDAERVVEAFGERLRTGADPYTAVGDLTNAVERTLQPSEVGIWVRS